MASLCDGSLDKTLKIYTRPQLLLIDEVGFDRIEQESARNAAFFFKVIDARYCKGSTIVTCNIDFKELGDYLGGPGHNNRTCGQDGPSFHNYPHRRPEL